MQHNAWISAHLFYHDDHTLLLARCVKPLVDELRASRLITKYFFIRYWQGGPHIRLRLLPAESVQKQAIYDLVAQRAQAFFLAHPSTSTLDIQQYEAGANSLSFLEYGKNIDIHLYENNSLQYIPYEPEYERYGGEKALPAVETHFMESSDIVLQCLYNGLNAAQRVGLVTGMTLLALALSETELEKLVTSLSGQYQALDSGLAYIRSSFREIFYKRYQQERQSMHKLVETVLEKARKKTFEDDTPLTKQWATSVATLCDKLRQLELEGSLRGQTRQHHLEALQEQEPDRNEVLAIVFWCLHMHGNRFGLSMIEEAYIRALLIAAVSELTSKGISEK